MPRTALTVQPITRSGLAPTYGAANASGHSFQNTGREFVHVKNAGVGACTVTIETPGTVDGLAVADRTVAVGAGAEAMIGPFTPSTYDQPGGQDVYVDFDEVTSVTVAAIRL